MNKDEEYQWLLDEVQRLRVGSRLLQDKLTYTLRDRDHWKQVAEECNRKRRQGVNSYYLEPKPRA